MDSYATKLAEAFAASTLKHYYESAVTEKITNQDWEGKIKNKASVLNMLTFGKLSLHDYTGATMTRDDIEESNAQLVTDQMKYFYFGVKDIDEFKSYIKNPPQSLLDQLRDEITLAVDEYILGFYGDVAAGNRYGTDYTTGTVDIDADGNVTGSSTTFTSAMVGRGFKATGHSKWYRVKSVASDTSMVIEQDLDDTDASYDGGVISSASYTIEAVTPVTVDKTTVYDVIVEARNILNKQRIPKSNRWIVLPSDISSLVLKSSQFTPAVETAYNEVVKRGLIGSIAGFTVYESEAVSGDNTSGYHVLAGHRSAITYAMANTENGIEDLVGNFGKAYKGLYVYGAKVADVRRAALAELFLKV